MEQLIAVKRYNDRFPRAAVAFAFLYPRPVLLGSEL